MRIRLLVREIRLERGLSIRQLETLTGVARSILSKLENDPSKDIKIKTACRIAKGLGCKLDDIIEYK